MKKIVLIFVFLMFPIILFALPHIKLTNNRTGKVLFLKEGTRIGYVLKKQRLVRAGTIQHITDSSIQVGKTHLAIRDLRLIGRRSFGAVGLEFLIAGVSGIVAVFSIAPDNNSSNIRTIGGFCAIAIFGIALYIGESNSPKDIIKEWKLEIVELR
jgi:hypothetical protein